MLFNIIVICACDTLSVCSAAATFAANGPQTLNLDHVSPVTRLLAKRKQLVVVQQSLDAQKTEYIRKEEMFRSREENLRKRDLELQEALVLFNKFLKENEHKRRRAELKVAEEMENRKNREDEIDGLHAMIRQRTMMLEARRTEHEKHHPYQQYLTSLLESHGSFFDDEPTVDMVLQRYETLQNAQADLIAQHAEYSRESERIRQEYITLHKSFYTDALLRETHNLSRLSQMLEEAVAKTSDAEESLRAKEAATTDQMRRISLIVMGVDNILNRCKHAVLANGTPCQIKHASELPPRSGPWKVEYTSEQLNVISHFLDDFKAITQQLGGLKQKSGGGGGGGVNSGGFSISSSVSTYLAPNGGVGALGSSLGYGGTGGGGGANSSANGLGNGGSGSGSGNIPIGSSTGSYTGNNSSMSTNSSSSSSSSQQMLQGGGSGHYAHGSYTGATSHGGGGGAGAGGSSSTSTSGYLRTNMFASSSSSSRGGNR